MLSKLYKLVAWFHGDNKPTEEIAREIHCFEIGFAETFCLFIPSRFPPTTFAHFEMKEEFHYYGIGRAVGILTWVLILIGLLKW